MKRLLDDLAAQFDLEHRVRGVRLAELIERFDMDLDQSPLRDFGTPGAPGKVASKGQGPVRLHYVPHLFPEMESKLRLAHRLQYHLLPTGVPAASFFSIAAVLESFCHLSGDLFGWRMRDDGEFLIWIVDVSGHGVETGLASAVIKAIVDHCGDRGGAHEVVGELNEAMCRCVRPGGRALFATGFFMTLTENGEGEFCSAGHPPALVTGPKSESRELGVTSLPIGLFQGQRYEVETTRIAQGETLFLYTDGLIELTTRAGDQFGLPRLRKFVERAHREPRALTEALYRSIADEHDMASLTDDVTFVALRMRES